MIHRFVDLLDEEVLEPNVIYNIRRHTGGTERLFTIAGNGAAPVLVGTSIETVHTPEQPELSPDGTEFVYVRIDGAAPLTENEIRVGPTDESSSPATVALNPSGASQAAFGGTQIIGWSPDGQQIYYRGENNNTDRDTEIRVMDKDGSNNTLLWSSTTLKSTDWGQVPRLSPDGTMIALWVDFDGEPDMGLWVMDSDGTNMTRIYDAFTGGDFYGWSRDSSRLVFQDANFSASPRWNRIMACDPDGSNLTVLYDRQISGSPIDDEIVLGFGQNSIWLPDNSGVVARYDLGGTEPNHEIGVLSSDGSETWTPLSPQRLADGAAGGATVPHFGAVAHDTRVWWVEGTGAGSEKVVSALFDGSDYRVDHDMDTDPTLDDYRFIGFFKRAS